MTSQTDAPPARRYPAVIVVMGVAGAGKTTVGQALAASLGRTFHDADDFHPPANVARMRAGVPLTDTDRAPWLARLRDLIARHLADGTPAVLACSALRRAYRLALTPVGAPADAVRFLFLDVTPAVAAQRLVSRQGHFMPATLVESQFATLEVPVDATHEALRVDASLPVAEIVDEVRHALG